MLPVSEAIFFTLKKTGFQATLAIKQQRRLAILENTTMVCSYRSSYLDLTVVFVDFQVEGYASQLHHVYQGEYVAMYEINIDGVERKICRDCVDGLIMGGKPDKLKKVGHSTVYRTDE